MGFMSGVVGNKSTTFSLPAEIIVPSNLAVGKLGLNVVSKVAQTNSPLVRFFDNNAGTTKNTLDITSNTSGVGCYITMGGTGAALGLIQSNAASGNVGIYFFGANATAPIFEVAGYSTYAGRGALDSYIKIYVAGAVRYLRLYS